MITETIDELQLLTCLYNRLRRLTSHYIPCALEELKPLIQGIGKKRNTVVTKL